MENIYYSPEKHGLEILGMVEEDVSYEFNMFVVWKRTEDGALFYASDSGCSCPSPFEDFANVESLNRITSSNDKTFERDLQEWSKSYNGGSRVSVSEINDLTGKVREALSEENNDD